MNRLPNRWQLAIKFRFQEQLSFDEIASVLEITPNVVHQLVHRAVQQLRRLLTENPSA